MANPSPLFAASPRMATTQKKSFRCPILSLNATIICPNPKHRNRAAKQSKDGVFFREKLLRKPALSPALLEGAVGSSGCRMRMTNADKETAARGTFARRLSFIGSADQISNAADDSYFLSDAPIEAFPTSIE